MTDSTASQKQLINELQLALQEFDGVKVASIVQQGLDLRHVYLDPQKYHNAIHELVLNYVTLQSIDAHEKLHMKFLDTLTVLVDSKLDINAKDIKNQTVLHLTASYPGHSQVLRELLARGVPINQPDSGQQTALHKAVIHGTLDDVRTLLERGADANFVDNVGYSPLHLAVKRRKNDLIIKELVKCGGKVNLNHPQWNRQLQGATPLHTAARFGRTENAVSLLKLMANPNVVDAAGQTPLHIAATHEVSGELCKQLLRTGTKVDLPDSICGETALHKAVTAGTVENIRILLQIGNADPNVADHLGNTALHKAAVNQSTSLEVWQLLFIKGGKTNTMNSNKEIPLNVAHDPKNHSILALHSAIQHEVHL